ncbi:FxSxx-COOH system tetratricopeptide repeat protein [Streptosporangium sp. LJ11]|uniref:FxSxx-COOH system tetratricopeptide repeat protein n=1 Tax=Streptosporangium sp. LJ11 TaxID=3436927 RepID=UPI003F794BE2
MPQTPPEAVVTASGAKAVAAGGDIGQATTGDHSPIYAPRLEPGSLLPARQVHVRPHEPVRHMEAPRAWQFVGRGQELEQLREMLTGEGAPVVVRQVLYGMGGVGKSELVRQYAHLYQDRYPVAWWITADSPRNLHQGLAALAAVLHPPVGLVGDVEQAATWALDWLQAHPGWLVVLDNVEDPDDIRPHLNRLSAGHLVITTRRDVYWQGLTPLALPVLDRVPALKLMRAIIEQSQPLSPDQGADLETIAAELGYLPLALEQAAAYMHQQHCSPTRYLRQLREEPAQIHARFPHGGEAERIMARLWHHHLTALQDHDQRTGLATEHLLRVLACYAPDDIPRLLLGVLPPGDHQDEATKNGEDGWDEALGVLASYSMIARSGVDEAETISMHRLFQSVIRHGLDYDDPRQHVARSTALIWMGQALPPDPDSNVSGWPLWRDLMPHIDALVSCNRHGDEPVELSLILNQATLFTRVQGQHQRAHDLAQRALAIAEAAYGPDHPIVATLLGNLAVNFRALGQPGEAVLLEQRALAIAEAAYGPDHPIVATLLGNLAGSFRALGQPGEAVLLEQRALAIAEAAHGPDHPTVATLLGNLAGSFCDLGRPGEAVPLEQRALAITEAAHGPDHPDVAIRLSNLALSFRNLGRPGEAVPLFERALAITEATYGPDHPSVAIGLGNLALSFYDLGRPGEAVPLEQRALAITEATYGPDHPDVAIRLGNLAASFRALGRPGEAVPLFERALAITEATYGPDHPDVAIRLGNLAGSFHALGRPGEAVPLFERALAITEAAHGPDHPDVAIGLGNLAGSFRALGRPGEAVLLEQRALAITEATYGPDHPSVAIWLGNLAVSFRVLGRPGEAVPLFERALAITEAAYGPDHPDVAIGMGNLAGSFRVLGRPGEAVPLEQRALAITEAAYGPDHPDVAIWLGNLAVSFHALGRPGEAVPLFERALAITEATYGPDHPDVAIGLGNLAVSFRALGRPGEAVLLFERAVAITEAAYGPDHPDVAALRGALSYTMNASCHCGSGKKLKRCHGTASKSVT